MFQEALDNFAVDGFTHAFKEAFKLLPVGDLPLSVCCQHSGNIDENSIVVTILSSAETEKIVQLKIGIFFQEVLAGCACSDDSSQAMIYENGYCELTAEINKTTALISFS
ncbi:MAG: hypothetical protein DSY43_03605 [Gammaproteobacteria bacterium]|nr:MAG: hypothetical protein DSY43_03605 [Gammaproteobacteria bacterium]